MSVQFFSRATRRVTGLRLCSSYKPIKRPGSRDVQSKKLPESTNPNKFTDALRAQIKAAGPMTVADYMRRVLTNPAAGYYMHQDVFGSKGDYITSPEINQIFGELISLWCLMEWRKVGSPSPVQLIELGPGRGTMIQDILRVLTRFEMQRGLSVHLVEVSPYLARAQASRLCYKHSDIEDPSEKYYLQGESIGGTPIYWYKSLDDVPLEFSVILAHEFYDAMPIHILRKTDSSWKEVLIDANDNSVADGDQFRYVISQNETPISKLAKELLGNDENRDHVEYSTEQQTVSKNISERLESHGGIALIMDYGHEGEKGDTFRSFKNHQLHSPLKDPGTADLTADVNFAQIKRHFQDDDKCVTFGPVTQRLFLKGMGAETRINKLIENATTEEQKVLLKSGFEMLVENNQMGERFKFLAVYPKVLRDHLNTNPPTAFTENE